MFPFSKLPPFDATERKALLLAIIGSLLFLSFLVSISPRNHASSAPIPPKTVPAKPAPAGDSFAIYRIKPEQFYDVDFWNYYYGRYTLRNGKKIHLNLTNSQLESLDGSDRFALKDVYYRDVTGDGEPEAIVWLLHVHCAGSWVVAQTSSTFTRSKTMSSNLFGSTKRAATPTAAVSSL